MATKGKKPRARWDSDTERKLIDVWADILGEFSAIMMTRKQKEAIATTCLNVYVSEELNRPENFNEKEVCNKLDTIMKKGKSMYVGTNEKEKQVKSTHKMMSISTLKRRKRHGQTSSTDLRIILHWVLVQWRNPV